MGDIKITRAWAMPNSKTFSIKPFKELIEKYKKELPKDAIILDPFANGSKEGTITNDLDPEFDTDYHMNADDFLKMFEDNSVDMVLFDPPYTPTQVVTCYKKLGKTVDWQSTSISFWTNMKKDIARILKPNGICLTFGFNSGGIGKKNGCEIEEILFVAHGSQHNDTFCVVDRKVAGKDEKQKS